MMDIPVYIPSQASTESLKLCKGLELAKIRITIWLILALGYFGNTNMLK